MAGKGNPFQRALIGALVVIGQQLARIVGGGEYFHPDPYSEDDVAKAKKNVEPLLDDKNGNGNGGEQS